MNLFLILLLSPPALLLVKLAISSVKRLAGSRAMGDPSDAAGARNPFDEVREEVNEAFPPVPVPRVRIQREIQTLQRGIVQAAALQQTVLHAGRPSQDLAEVIAGPDIHADPNEEPARLGRVVSLNPNPLVVEHSDMTPSLDVIIRSRGVALIDDEGNERSFGALLDELRTLRAKKVLVIFIRHFFCGHCQDYVRALSEAFPNPRQDLPDLSNVVIVGCGAHTLIKQYRNSTGCPFTLYTEPTAELVKIFGMKRNLTIGKNPPTFSSRSSWSLTWTGIRQGLSRIFKGDVHRAGSPAQNGGEILFKFEQPRDGPGLIAIRATWCHIMKTTRDHAPIEVIRRVLGAEDP